MAREENDLRFSVEYNIFYSEDSTEHQSTDTIFKLFILGLQIQLRSRILLLFMISENLKY